MNKRDLLSKLETVLNNYIFGIAASRLVPDSIWETTRGKTAGFESPSGETLRVDLSALALNMANPDYRKILVEEFENCLKRAIMREGHELILQYCEETDQFDKYKSQSWFQFSRIIRNVVSHKQGGNLRVWPRNLTKNNVTSVSWRNRTLDTSMVGKDIRFTHNEALQLFIDQREFAKNMLS